MTLTSGHHLRTLRRRHGLTVEHLALLVCYPAAHLRRVERGEARLGEDLRGRVVRGVEEAQMAFGTWKCRECKLEFHGGGDAIHEPGCSHYGKWPEPGDGGVFGPYAGCDYRAAREPWAYRRRVRRGVRRHKALRAW